MLKKDSWVPNQNTMQKNVAHSKSNAVYIKYSKVYSGFESVPRKKDTFKKPYLDLLLIHYWREHGGQPQITCSNLEQTTLEMGEPELPVTQLIWQIT